MDHLAPQQARQEQPPSATPSQKATPDAPESIWLDAEDLADMDLYRRERQGREAERPPHY